MCIRDSLLAPGSEGLTVPLDHDLLAGGEGYVKAGPAGGRVDHPAAQVRRLLGPVQHNGGVLHTGEDIQGVGMGGRAQAGAQDHGQGEERDQPMLDSAW